MDPHSLYGPAPLQSASRTLPGEGILSITPYRRTQNLLFQAGQNPLVQLCKHSKGRTQIFQLGRFRLQKSAKPYCPLRPLRMVRRTVPHYLEGNCQSSL